MVKIINKIISSLSPTGALLAVESRDAFWEVSRDSCSQSERPVVAGSLGPYGVISQCNSTQYQIGACMQISSYFVYNH